MTVDLLSLPRGSGRVRLVCGEYIAELIIDHPERRNAISPGMMRDLSDAVGELERWSGALVLVRGEGGRAFCSGGDLVAVREHLLDASLAKEMAEHMGATLDRLSELPQLVIAAVDGAALGGGAELLMCADRVLASRDALVGFVHIQLGVSPGWGGGQRLVRRVGPHMALKILVEGRRMSGQDALECGLVDQLCDGPAEVEAREWLESLESHPPGAIRAAVSLVRSGERSVEQAEFLSLWGGRAHREALSKNGSEK